MAGDIPPTETPDTPVAPTVEPDLWAHLCLLVLLVAAVIVAFVVGDNGHRTFQVDKANFALFAGFYVAAQLVERILEVVSPLFPFWPVRRTVPATGQQVKGPTLRQRVGSAPKPTPGPDVALIKADRGMIMLGLGTLAGTVVSGSLGLYFLKAVGIDGVSKAVDMLATGLVISGGSKSLHEFINLIQKPANPPGTPTNG